MADSFWETIVTLILALLEALLCVGLGICLLFPWGLSSSLSRPSIWSLVTGTEPPRQNNSIFYYEAAKVGQSLHNFIRIGHFFLKIYPIFQIIFFGATLNKPLVNSSSERSSTHSDFGGSTHKLRAMGTRKEVRKKEEREKKDRHLPNIQGGVPGGRFFLTSMFCFIKAANWAEMSWGKKPEEKL